MPVRAVLFDIDDTLLDYSAAERGGILGYLAELGLPEDRCAAGADVWHQLQEQHFGRFLAGEVDFPGQQRARAAGMLDWLGLPALSGAEELAGWFAGYRRHHQLSLRVFADVVDCLTGLSSTVALGVVSNNDEAAAREKLDRTGLLAHFRCVVCVDTAGCAKPAPGIFRHACRALGVPPAETLYVGDQLATDAVAAHDAGLRGVWLDRSSSDVVRADARVRRITALTELMAMPEFGARTSPMTSAADLI